MKNAYIKLRWGFKYYDFPWNWKGKKSTGFGNCMICCCEISKNKYIILLKNNTIIYILQGQPLQQTNIFLHAELFQYFAAVSLMFGLIGWPFAKYVRHHDDNLADNHPHKPIAIYKQWENDDVRDILKVVLTEITSTYILCQKI